MRFRIPQFLDIEDKIFGPFTIKQFSYLVASVAIAYVFWKLIPIKILAIPLILVFSGTFLAVAFVQVNGRPFMEILEAAYKFAINSKMYVWQKKEYAPINRGDVRAADILRNFNLPKQEEAPNISKRLKVLSGKLDILDEEKKANINLRQEILRRNSKK